MFNNAAPFNQDLSAWDVSRVTFNAHMFDSATSFNQNLCSWRDNFPYNNADNTYWWYGFEAGPSAYIFKNSGCTYTQTPDQADKSPFCASDCGGSSNHDREMNKVNSLPVMSMNIWNFCNTLIPGRSSIIQLLSQSVSKSSDDIKVASPQSGNPLPPHVKLQTNNTVKSNHHSFMSVSSTDLLINCSPDFQFQTLFFCFFKKMCLGWSYQLCHQSTLSQHAKLWWPPRAVIQHSIRKKCKWRNQPWSFQNF